MKRAAKSERPQAISRYTAICEIPLRTPTNQCRSFRGYIRVDGPVLAAGRRTGHLLRTAFIDGELYIGWMTKGYWDYLVARYA